MVQNLEGPKVFIDRDFDELNSMLRDWYEQLMAHKCVIIAIARKAPRLLNYCRLKYPDLYNPDVVVISEIAIPFIDWKTVTVPCLVIDEAIYHGTTFERVLGLVKNSTNDTPIDVKGLPLVITQDAFSAPKITSSLIDGWSFIDNDTCNFYIDTIVSKFFELGKPYDVEYPLFYACIDDTDFTSEQMDGMISRVMEKLSHSEPKIPDSLQVYFKNINYRREDSKLFSAFTYCTDYLFDENGMDFKPDFSKLRVFYTDKRICIASMAPHTINIRHLERNCLLFDGEQAAIWNDVIESIKENVSQNEKLIEQKRKSLVVFANYLLSVNHFLRFKQRLNELFAEAIGLPVHFELQQEDLKLLIGEKLSSQIVGRINQLSVYPDVALPYMIGNKKESVIPTLYEKDYSLQLSLDNMFDKKTVNAVISNMFSDLHWMVEVRSREQARDIYDRLQFGESLSSIKNMCTSLIPGGSNLIIINRNIDARIDRGSMVPDYVRVNGVYDICWQRMFRSGENEDLAKDQYLRIAVNVLTQYFNKSNFISIKKHELQLLFALLGELENIFFSGRHKYNRVFAHKVNIEWKNDEYCICILHDDGSRTDIISKLIDYHLIVEKNNTEYELADSSYLRQLQSNLPLEDKVSKRILRILDFVIYVHKNLDETSTIELKNYACVSIAVIERVFSEWKQRVSSYIQRELGFEDFGKLVNDFIRIYMAIPEPVLMVHDNTFSSSEVGTWLRNRVQSDEIHEFSVLMLDNLQSVFYILNCWNKYCTGHISRYYGVDMFTSLVQHLKKNDSNLAILTWLEQTCGANMNVDKLDMDENELQANLNLLLETF